MNNQCKLTITTFAESSEQIEQCAKNGANSFIIEDPAYSLLCRSEPQNGVNYDRLTTLINAIRKVSAKDASIIFNLDIIAHNNDFDDLKSLMNFLLHKDINTVRIMDSGVANYLLREYPEIKIQLNTETGNNNYASIQFWKEKLGVSLDKIILSKELEYKHIKDIISKTHIHTELQIHGFVMLLYTKRRVLNGLDKFKDRESILDI